MVHIPTVEDQQFYVENCFALDTDPIKTTNSFHRLLAGFILNMEFILLNRSH
jgi:hypothetical protein